MCFQTNQPVADSIFCYVHAAYAQSFHLLPTVPAGLWEAFLFLPALKRDTGGHHPADQVCGWLRQGALPRCSERRVPPHELTAIEESDAGWEAMGGGGIATRSKWNY